MGGALADFRPGLFTFSRKAPDSLGAPNRCSHNKVPAKYGRSSGQCPPFEKKKHSLENKKVYLECYLDFAFFEESSRVNL